MELLFVYIERHKNIIDAGINFNPEYSFCVKKNGAILELSIIKSNSKIPDNFFGERIVNISAIIGENGTGKTNLLEVLRSGSATLEIWKRDDGRFYYWLDNEFRSPKYDLKIPEEFVSMFLTTHEPYIIRNVFYSPIFDSRNYPFERIPEDIDVSTNYLLKVDSENELSGKKDYDQVTFHKLKDIQRQVEFIYSGLMPDSSKYNLSLPKEIDIRITDITNSPKTDAEWNLDINSREVRQILLTKLRNELDVSGKQALEARNEYEKTKAHIKRTKYFFLINLVQAYFYNRNNTNHYLNEELGVDISEINTLDADNALLYFASHQNWITADVLKGFIELIISIFDNAFDKEYKIDDSDFNSLTIPLPCNEFLSIQSYQLTFLREVSELNFGANVIQPFDFSWRDMSSGEKAVLNVFSRLLYAKQLLINEIESPKNDFGVAINEINLISIRIDEGEMGFHPDWQKKYLSTLIDFIPICFFHEKYMPRTKIQLFLTSHSPFLVSDLPKENIVFLTTTQAGFMKISDLNGHEKTFGSNIHTLFSDAFFMKQGLIGDFAFGKIDLIIEKINQLKNSYSNPSDQSLYESDKSDILNTIELIGEPVIKNKLLKDYLNLYKEDEEITYYKRKIEELEYLKRQRQNDQNSQNQP